MRSQRGIISVGLSSEPVEAVHDLRAPLNGTLARVVAASRAELATVDAVIRVARRAGLRVERTGERAMEVVS